MVVDIPRLSLADLMFGLLKLVEVPKLMQCQGQEKDSQYNVACYLELHLFKIYGSGSLFRDRGNWKSYLLEPKNRESTGTEEEILCLMETKL